MNYFLYSIILKLVIPEETLLDEILIFIIAIQTLNLRQEGVAEDRSVS